MTDYLKEGDVGFKKPKVRILSYTLIPYLSHLWSQTKKKRPSRRVVEVDEEQAGDQMAVDETSIVPRARDLDTNFVDDDELQAALARSRRAKTRKPKKLAPEDIARASECAHPWRKKL